MSSVFSVSSVVVLLAIAVHPDPAAAQTITQRGFVEGRALFFPQDAPNDPTRAVADLLAREEAFLKPAAWIQFAAGIEFRANSHDQVEPSWRLDFGDRTLARPRLSVRRLSATMTRSALAIDLGRQFIRWGKTDIVTPTDWLAPRDFLNVFENDFLPVTGVRASVRAGAETFEAAWTPRLTPSRIPLLNQRWTAVPPAAAQLSIVDLGSLLPDGSQFGVRWSHVGRAFESAVSFFDGFNHLPNVDVVLTPIPERIGMRRMYPAMRSFGVDAAAPLPWATIKAEAAYSVSPMGQSDDYVLYVVQFERQTGEWAFVGGYAGDIVTRRRAALPFAPDRGVARALVGRASYTVDANRSVAFECAVRQTGDGAYAKGEYSQAYAANWRATVSGTLIRGEPMDFIGQYRRNSNISVSLRYSF